MTRKQWAGRDLDFTDEWSVFRVAFSPVYTSEQGCGEEVIENASDLSCEV